MIAYENSGHVANDDFPVVRKIVEAGATENQLRIMNCHAMPVKEGRIQLDE